MPAIWEGRIGQLHSYPWDTWTVTHQYGHSGYAVVVLNQARGTTFNNENKPTLGQVCIINLQPINLCIMVDQLA